MGIMIKDKILNGSRLMKHRKCLRKRRTIFLRRRRTIFFRRRRTIFLRRRWTIFLRRRRAVLFISNIIFSWGRINKVGENIVWDVVFHHQWFIVS